MKLIKYLGLGIGALIAVGLVLFFILRSTLAPTYSGEVSLPGLIRDVDVYYTSHGIPHVYAENERDLYYSLGYVQAQDRLWQMDLLRRVGSGRLAEILGPDLVGVDKLFRSLGINAKAADQAKTLAQNPQMHELAKAYIAGINAYVASHPKPLEHLLLSVDVEPFTIENMYHVVGYMAFSFAAAHRTDPLLTEMAQQLDSVYLAELPIHYRPGDGANQTVHGEFVNFSNEISQVIEGSNIPMFMGSNSWVLGPKKSSGGNTLLANDLHIGYAQPSVWYETHVTSPAVENYGYYLCGYPFPILVHNQQFATGLTMFENDDIDLYKEVLNEQKTAYLFQNEWLPVSTRNEIIKVKGDHDVSFEISSTQHGPIVTTVLGDSTLVDPLAMNWTYVSANGPVDQATYKLTDVKNVEEFVEAAQMIHAPGLNVMYGDAAGNYVWWASAWLTKRDDESRSKFIVDGSIDSIPGLYPTTSNPHAINPPIGYVHSANQQSVGSDSIYFGGYYYPMHRSDKITSALSSKDNWSVDDVKALMMNNESDLMQQIQPVLINAADDKTELLDYLASWDGSMTEASFAPTVFQTWLFEIMRLAMHDELGGKMWDGIVQTVLMRRNYTTLILNDTSVWWDDINTPEVENRNMIIKKAYINSIEKLTKELGDDFTEWSWGSQHTLTHKHPMAINSLMEIMLNVGPFPISGGDEVINNQGHNYTDGVRFPVTFGPSTRRIIDFSDPRNNSWSINPTGQSGNIFSPYYDDQAEMFVNGEFRKMIMNHDEIKRSQLLLKLRP
ncbi:MAG: penicillin acylase family protein [Cyclobacteriaceae bacterium]